VAASGSTTQVSSFLLIGAVASVVLLLVGLFVFHASQDSDLQEYKSRKTPACRPRSRPSALA
jgi:amino acid permease